MKELNENQFKVIKHLNGPLLVIAGAGTGKTSVIAYRIAHLIQKEGINTGNILALTFSNKAAEEMRNRVDVLLPSSHDEVLVSTFHSFCAEILRENALEFGISPFFKLITEPEQLLLLVTNINRLGLKYYEVKGSPHGLLKQMLDLISRAKDEMITADDYVEFSEKQAGSVRDNDLNWLKIGEAASVYSNYQRLLLEHDCLDFGDLILYAIEGFKKKPDLLSQYQQRFQYILVDEFQDTNFAQGQLLDMLAAYHRNLCVVGDDDQSIYRFRGASIKNILDFERKYPDTEIITLDENYRSSQEILDVSHSLIVHNSSRRDKRLKAVVKETRINGDPVKYLVFDNDKEQSQYVVREIEGLMAEDETLNLSDMAVLIRSVKTQSRPITAALESAGISYNLSGGSGFFERKEIRDILSWMKIIDNPFDAENLVRAIDVSPFNIAPIHLCRISNWGRDNSDLNLFDALKEVGSVPNMDDEVIEEIRIFCSLVQGLMDKKEELTAGEMTRQIIDKIVYRERLLRKDVREFMIGLANLQKLEDMAKDYSSMEGYSNLRSFLRHITYLMFSSEKPMDLPFVDAINIMTIHQAKGLEFRVVFMTDLVQSKFPGRRRTLPIDLPGELLKEELPEIPPRELHLNEERRLFYVGVTRAKERLYLFHVKRYKEEQRENKPSQFVTEALGERPESEYQLDKTNMPLDKDTSSGFNLARTVMDLAKGMKFRDAEKVDFISLLKEGLQSQIEFFKGQLLNEREIGQFERKLEDINQSVNDLFPQNISSGLLNPEMDRELRNTFLCREKRRQETIPGDPESCLEFLPIVDGGLDITFSALNTYMKCPLMFKYAFIYRIPTKSTVNMKGGIILHNVLEYFHKNYTRVEARVDDLLKLFEDRWKAARLPDSLPWRQLKEKAVNGLTAYFESFLADKNKPEYFERPFTLRVGKHRVKGRVDRVDITPAGGYELIDYKTGRTWTQREVDKDLQLSVYSLGAMEVWSIKPEKASYYFLFENKKGSISHQDEQLKEANQRIMDSSEEILSENFEPKPDFQNCRYCDYKALCKVGEMG